jgi:uncharacterized protein RhaS with RHS repeats
LASSNTCKKTPDDTFTLTDHLGQSTHFNADGLLTSRVDLNGNATTYVYTDADGDGISNDISQIVDPYGRSTSYSYDSGYVDSITDFAGRSTLLQYESGRLTSIIEPDPDGPGPLPSPITSLSYDESGKLSTILDPVGDVQSVAYDVFGLASSGINADGTAWTLESVLPAFLMSHFWPNCE